MHTSIGACKQIFTLKQLFGNLLMELPLRDQNAFGRTFHVLKLQWTLGDVVRKLREGKGWTQTQLGEKAGLDKSAIVRLERESHKSERQTIERVARALGVFAADVYSYVQEISLASELTEVERMNVMAFERRLLLKRRRDEGIEPGSLQLPDLHATTPEVREQVRKRRQR